MSIVRLANNITRGPVAAILAENVSISACRATAVPTKPACFDDPACLSKVVELVYCDQESQITQHNAHRLRMLLQVVKVSMLAARARTRRPEPSNKAPGCGNASRLSSAGAFPRLLKLLKTYREVADVAIRSPLVTGLPLNPLKGSMGVHQPDGRLSAGKGR